MYVEVAVAVPSEKTFTYAVPENFAGDIALGKRVLVPFGRKRLTGYIVGILGQAEREGLKEILEVLDETALFNEEDYEFYRWAAAYYMYPLGKALEEILPGGINIDSGRWVCLVDDGGADGLTERERTILDILRKNPGGLSVASLQREADSRQLLRSLNRLQQKGMIRIEERMARPAVTARREKFVSMAPGWCNGRLSEKAGAVVRYLSEAGETTFSELRRRFGVTADTVRRLGEKGAVVVTEREVYRKASAGPTIAKMDAVTLNSAQEEAAKEILKGLLSGKFSPFLLHGVTGSGKTEVYFRALAEALDLGGSVIYLVPEIALTPQLLSRLRDRFKEHEMAVLHSGVPAAVRYDQWRMVARGDIRLVVGARSALFAPVRDLRLIIVDEEHDNSYKQDERMPYNARDLAVVRARQRGATVILGSATPSIQSYSNALRGKYRHLVLTDRPKGLGLPEVEVLDLRREREEKGKTPLLSRPLVEAIGETLETGKQTLLFLNRRGFHTFLFCADCGYVLKCLNCSVSLTFHAASGILKCHHCDFSVKAPPLCPACKGNRVRSYGAGTERLEAEVAKIFPGARVGRMDSDMAGGRAQQEKTLLALDKGEIDILIGTQMVAKGHDYPNVVLVGVIMADASLNLPDFRAAEYTFQLLTQVSGRGGRGDETGRVIIQTFNPEHYAVRFACGHDYRGFYEEEIVLRKALGYPPFLRLVNVRISGLKKENVEECAREVAEMTRALAKSLAPGESVDIIGPAEAPIPKLKGRYRWQLILKGKSVQSLHGVAQNILSQRRRRGVDVRVDVDPLNFM